MPAKRRPGRMKPCAQCGKEFYCFASVDVGGSQRERKHCSRKCMGDAYRGTPEDFWAKVDTRGPDECWQWKSARFKKKNKQMGYGRHAGSGPFTYAHRCAWIFTFGPIPDGKLIMHKCDNVLCCNPSHLQVGTDRENIADMKAKGRYRHRYQPIEELLHPELSRKQR